MMSKAFSKNRKLWAILFVFGSKKWSERGKVEHTVKQHETWWNHEPNQCFINLVFPLSQSLFSSFSPGAHLTGGWGCLFLSPRQGAALHSWPKTQVLPPGPLEVWQLSLNVFQHVAVTWEPMGANYHSVSNFLKVKRVMDMFTFLDELPILAFDVFGL